MKTEKGMAAVEFAIVLPVLVLLIVGTMEFSVLFYNQAVITNASREGARVGIVYSDPPISDAKIEDVVNNYCARLITFDRVKNPPGVPPPLRAGSGSAADPFTLTVLVNYEFHFLVVPNFLTDLAREKPLSAQTVMRMEDQN